MEPTGSASTDATGVPGGTPRWRRVVAFVVSFLFPGISQADDGEFRRGISWYLGLQVAGIAGELIAYAALGRPWVSMGVFAAVAAGQLGVIVWLAVDGYRRERTPARRGPAKRAIAVYLVFVAAAIASLAVTELVKTRLVTAYGIPARSMEPTLMLGDRILVDRSAYGAAQRPQRGDVAVFIFPDDREKLFIKRVVAVPGDTVEIRHKKLLVNGKAVREEYAAMSADEDAVIGTRDNMKRVLLQDGKYFVLGDNRDRSYDSRMFGPVDGKDFLGKAACIYYSRDLRRIGTVIR